MKTFKEFLAETKSRQLMTEDVLQTKTTGELFDIFCNRKDLSLHESKIIASGLFLRYRSQIYREKNIDKKFQMLIDAIALSSVLSVREVKKILKERE